MVCRLRKQPPVGFQQRSQLSDTFIKLLIRWTWSHLTLTCVLVWCHFLLCVEQTCKINMWAWMAKEECCDLTEQSQSFLRSVWFSLCCSELDGGHSRGEQVLAGISCSWLLLAGVDRKLLSGGRVPTWSSSNEIPEEQVSLTAPAGVFYSYKVKPSDWSPPSVQSRGWSPVLVGPDCPAPSRLGCFLTTNANNKSVEQFPPSPSKQVTCTSVCWLVDQSSTTECLLRKTNTCFLFL